MEDRANDHQALPFLGMIVDRTSFDETDDYGVNRDALETTSWSKEKPDVRKVNSIVMRDGKVRRRMRWRPKSLTKRRRQSKLFSSNVSVTSSGNASHAKSVHSFASVETAILNNTKKAKKQKGGFPLPRPNYPDTVSGRATIVSEASFIHARMGKSSSNPNNSSAPLFAAADLDATDTSAETSEDAFDPYVGDASPRRKTGFPPLFNQRRQQRKRAILKAGGNGGPAQEQTLERTVRDLLNPSELKEADGIVSNLESSTTTKTTSKVSSVPLPSLSSEDIEVERRVDLRVRRPTEHRQSSSSERREPTGRVTVKSMALTTDDLDQFGVQDAKGRRANEHPSTSKRTTRSSSKHGKQVVPVISHTQSSPNKPPGQQAPRLTPSRSEPLSPSESPRRPRSDSFDRKPTSPQRQQGREIQFSMSVPIEDERTPPSPSSFGNSKPYTGPVDVDDGCFLEVEKNLEAIHEMATEHLKHGEYTEALEVFEEILRGQLARYGQDHFRVGTALHNIGIVHMKSGDNLNAAKVSKEAIRVRKIAHDSLHPDVAVSLAQLGVAYMEMGKHVKAVSVFREALRIRRHCYGLNHPKVGKILNNIGCALYELNELEVAKVAFEEALTVQREALRVTQSESPVFSDQSLLSIASTLSNLGSIKLYWGLHHDAAINLEEVLLIQQSVLGDDHPVVQRTFKSLKWMENIRNQDRNATPSLSESSGLLFKKQLKSSTGTSPGIDRNIGIQEQPSNLSMCDPTVSTNDDTMDSSAFHALERRLKGLHFDFGCGEAISSDDESSVASGALSDGLITI
jgi:tetratricopeptide (TPR) repeat protein